MPEPESYDKIQPFNTEVRAGSLSAYMHELDVANNDYFKTLAYYHAFPLRSRAKLVKTSVNDLNTIFSNVTKAVVNGSSAVEDNATILENILWLESDKRCKFVGELTGVQIPLADTAGRCELRQIIARSLLASTTAPTQYVDGIFNAILGADTCAVMDNSQHIAYLKFTKLGTLAVENLKTIAKIGTGVFLGTLLAQRILEKSNK